MALRADLLTIRIQQHSSGTANEVVAETTSCSVDFTGEALDDTNQEDALVSSFMGGKISATASGDYLYLTSGEQLARLFAHINAGNVIEWEAYKSGSRILYGDGIITSLNLGGGLSDALTTGAYTMQLTGTITEP